MANYKEVEGTYGSGKTPSTIFVCENRDGSSWYVAEGSVNVNKTYNTIEDGVNIEELSDNDIFTAPKPINSLSDLEASIEDEEYAKGGKVTSTDLFEKIKKSGKISEQEMNLIRTRMNAGKLDAEGEELVQWIWDNNPELTADQNKKGLDFLMNLWKSPTGKERTNNPFGYREQEALEKFKYFELAGFHDIARYGQSPFYVSLYNVIGDDTNFQYYYADEMNIVGAKGGEMKGKGASSDFWSYYANHGAVITGGSYFNDSSVMEKGGKATGGRVGKDKLKEIKKRLEELRKELHAERISQGELAELQSLAEYIDPSDVELLEPAGVPEFVTEGDEVEVVSGANAGVTGHITTIDESSPFHITIKTEKGHILHGLNKNQLRTLSSGGSMATGGGVGVRKNASYLSDKEVDRYIDNNKGRFKSEKEFKKVVDSALLELRKDYEYKGEKLIGEEQNKNQIAFFEKVKQHLSKHYSSGGSMATGGEVDSQVKKIVSKFKPIAKKHSGSEKEGYSVLVKDKNSDFSAWIDVYISGDDVSNDWNKYIFNLKDSGDVRQKALQENNDIFESATSEAISYLEKKGAICQDEKANWHYGDKGSMATGGEAGSQNKTWVVNILMPSADNSNPKLRKEEIVLGRMSDDFDVQQAIKRKGEDWLRNGKVLSFYQKHSSGGSMAAGGEASGIARDRK